MKAIIYYSLSNNTKNELEARYEGDYYRLKGKIKIPKSYIMQLFYLGYLSMVKKEVAYEKLHIDFSKYDEIVLGSPVWAFTIVPFLRKFLKDYKFTNKKVTLLITHEGGPSKTMDKFIKMIDNSNTIVDKISIKKGGRYEKSNYIRKG